jgi:hypothetical protein
MLGSRATGLARWQYCPREPDLRDAGGGTIELNGVAPGSFAAGFVVEGDRGEARSLAAAIIAAVGRG